jgi:hypothetical protein
MAQHGASLRHLVLAAGDGERDDLQLRLDGRLVRSGGNGRLVDHRLRGRVDRELGRNGALGGALGRDDPGCDAELPDREVVVGRHEHARRVEERVALAACVLGEVLLQLAHEGLLVSVELLPVVGREVQRELVRDVHARDRDVPVVVHLLRELARQLDRLDVRSEGAPEHAFEQALDLRFDAAEHGHCAGCCSRRV